MGLAATIDKGHGRAGRLLRAACVLLLLALCFALAPISRAADAPLGATAYKMAGDATKMRIVIDFDREPDIKWFLLRGPNRPDMPGYVRDLAAAGASELHLYHLGLAGPARWPHLREAVAAAHDG